MYMHVSVGAFITFMFIYEFIHTKISALAVKCPYYFCNTAIE